MENGTKRLHIPETGNVQYQKRLRIGSTEDKREEGNKAQEGCDIKDDTELEGHDESSIGIGSLCDGLLLRIFSLLDPWPHQMNCARVCRRFYTLATDRRLFSRVVPTSDMMKQRHFHGNVFCSLEEAVRAARPGQTIIIEGGLHIAKNILVEVPVRLVALSHVNTQNGIYSRSKQWPPPIKPTEQTALVKAPKGSDSAFIFKASAKMVGVSIESELGNCVIQRRGRLILEHCMLHCLPHSLDHLSVAIAVAGGQVSVEGTVIMGGPKAVSVLSPIGTLGNTRVLCHQSKLLFWFCVQ